MFYCTLHPKIFSSKTIPRNLSYDFAHSNAVGYTTIPLTGGQMDIMGAQFVNCGTEALDIQSIVLNNAKANDTLQVYDAANLTYKTAYKWKMHSYDPVDDPDQENDLGPGWTDNLAYRLCDHGGNAVKIDPGQSFWITLAYEPGKEKSMTVSGQILPTDGEFATMDMVAGQMDLLNFPFPVVADIQDIKLVNAKANDTLQVYDAKNVAYVTAYKWKFHSYDLTDDPDQENDLGEGWTDNLAYRLCEHCGNGVKLGIGQGFWLTMAGDGKGNTPQVKFRNPLYVAPAK